MSIRPIREPECLDCAASDVALRIDGRVRDLGGFSVRRILPSSKQRLVGPFIFFDHMGPLSLPPGDGMDVRPHPHINLATVTYLFEGEIIHRDSLGSAQAIRPGAINWMTAGSGIVHSERSSDEERASGPRLHGIQAWVALPAQHEETAPAFRHHPVDAIPQTRDGGATLRVLAGRSYGLESPVRTFSPLFYVDAALEPGASLEVPDGYPERAAYVVTGSVACGNEVCRDGTMLVFAPGSTPRLLTDAGARLMLLGGDRLDGERHIWWNLVSSRPERIEEAKAAWKNGDFPLVPGDEEEFIPLPE